MELGATLGGVCLLSEEMGKNMKSYGRREKSWQEKRRVHKVGWNTHHAMVPEMIRFNQRTIQ